MNYMVDLSLAGVVLLCCLMILVVMLVRFVSQYFSAPDVRTLVKLHGGPQDGLEVMVEQGCKRYSCLSGECPESEYWAIYNQTIGNAFSYGGTEIRQKGGQEAKRLC